MIKKRNKPEKAGTFIVTDHGTVRLRPETLRFVALVPNFLELAENKSCRSKLARLIRARVAKVEAAATTLSEINSRRGGDYEL